MKLLSEPPAGVPDPSPEQTSLAVVAVGAPDGVTATGVSSNDCQNMDHKEPGNAAARPMPARA